MQYFEWNCNNSGRHWEELAGRAKKLAAAGITAIWLPPAFKAIGGDCDTGYAVYDVYDLGEFDQKGTVRTKYGTKDQYLAAIRAVKDAGMEAYADIVLNHKMGGDETEEVEVQQVSCEDRNIVTSEPYKIHAWSKYTFPGRAGKYSAFQWHWNHFNAFGANADQPKEQGKIYRLKDKTFSGEVDFEHGNFDYLMGADIDMYQPDVREELLRWGEWYVQTTGIDGFRLDAVKHIPASFYVDWLNHMREHFKREMFAVGEYWSGNLQEIEAYIDKIDGAMRLFDAPLHFNFQAASQQGRDYDLTKIFDGTLVKTNPLMAVTLVDNHDSQPGQSLESWVTDWFKPMAYALILLRKDGYPTIFYGDYYGNDEKGKELTSHRWIIDRLMEARGKYAYGDQNDYFDHPQCIGWVWSGDQEHPGSLAVVMSTGDEGTKHMNACHPGKTFYDITGARKEKVSTDEKGEADFKCNAGSMSVWCME